MPLNTRQKNGPVIHIRPSGMLRNYLDNEEVDWLTIILISPTKAILCNDRKHRNYLMTRPRIRGQIRGPKK